MSACVNAASLALIHAGVAMKDVVVASTAGLINSIPIMDVNYTEEGISSSPVFTIATLAVSKEILSLESTGRVSLDDMNTVQSTAFRSCAKLYEVMKQAIFDHLES